MTLDYYGDDAKSGESLETDDRFDSIPEQKTPSTQESSRDTNIRFTDFTGMLSSNSQSRMSHLAIVS